MVVETIHSCRAIRVPPEQMFLLKAALKEKMNQSIDAIARTESLSYICKQP